MTLPQTSRAPLPALSISPPAENIFHRKTLHFCRQFGLFIWLQIKASLFAGSFFLLLFLAKIIPLGMLHRYDFLFLAAIVIQMIFIRLKLETWQEVKTIFIFHLVGFALELFKTSPGIASWSYPEPAFFKIATVPLYSGFMYSAIGSYMNQAWKLFRLDFQAFPSLKMMVTLGLLIYLNFFTHHVLPDIRWYLVAAVFILFYRTRVFFTVGQSRVSMPLVLSFLLIGFFIWVGENISTYFGAWIYPDQVHHWTPVSFQKINCWFLLAIVSFNLVALLHHTSSKSTFSAKMSLPFHRDETTP